MDAYPEQHPEERFKVMHEGMSLALQRPDGHENLCARLASGARSLHPCFFDPKIQVDQERRPRGVVEILSYHKIVD